MAYWRAQCRLESVNDSADDVVNTYHFEGSLSEIDNIRDMLVDLYQDLSTWISDDAFTGELETKIYDLAETKPRVPKLVSVDTITALSSAGALVPQASIVATWQAAKVSGVNQARRRNRVYLGMLSATSVTSTGLVNPTTLTAVQTAFDNLFDAADASVNMDWRVYSPTSAAQGSGLADGFFGIVDGWIDNSVDIQRRRKIDSTVRAVFPTP